MDASNRHPSVSSVVQWFDYAHLPEDLQDVSKHFHDLAERLLVVVEKDTPEVIAGLRKLLEAKDCFVRAYVDIKRDVKDSL